MKEFASDSFLRLVSVLKSSRSHWIQWGDLLRKTGLDEKALRRSLVAVEEAGFSLERHPHLGYRLLGDYFPLIEEEIHLGLKTDLIGREIIVLKKVASTMEEAARLARSGCRAGLVLFAEEQTSGRGRMGRSWHSRKGKDLLFSVILKSHRLESTPGVITTSAALSVASALEDYLPLGASIRWPNDVVIGEKKVAGVLVEKVSSNGLILGIGINVLGTRAPVRGATTLVRETGKWIDRTELARALLSSLDFWYGRAVAGRFADIDCELKKRCSLIGKFATFQQGEKQISGKVKGISSLSGLQLELPGGELITLRAEQVSLVG